MPSMRQVVSDPEINQSGASPDRELSPRLKHLSVQGTSDTVIDGKLLVDSRDRAHYQTGYTIQLLTPSDINPEDIHSESKGVRNITVLNGSECTSQNCNSHFSDNIKGVVTDMAGVRDLTYCSCHEESNSADKHESTCKCEGSLNTVRDIAPDNNSSTLIYETSGATDNGKSAGAVRNSDTGEQLRRKLRVDALVREYALQKSEIMATSTPKKSLLCIEKIADEEGPVISSAKPHTDMLKLKPEKPDHNVTAPSAGIVLCKVNVE